MARPVVAAVTQSVALAGLLPLHLDTTASFFVQLFACRCAASLVLPFTRAHSTPLCASLALLNTVWACATFVWFSFVDAKLSTAWAGGLMLRPRPRWAAPPR